MVDVSIKMLISLLLRLRFAIINSVSPPLGRRVTHKAPAALKPEKGYLPKRQTASDLILILPFYCPVCHSCNYIFLHKNENKSNRDDRNYGKGR